MKCSLGISNFLEEISSLVALRYVNVVSVSHVQLFVTPWTAAYQASLSFTISQCLLKFRLKLKKVGKTTRQFRYDLNQIPYDYAGEVRNRFKGLDMID